jgi:hypothetical protein
MGKDSAIPHADRIDWGLSTFALVRARADMHDSVRIGKRLEIALYGRIDRLCCHGIDSAVCTDIRQFFQTG